MRTFLFAGLGLLGLAWGGLQFMASADEASDAEVKKAEGTFVLVSGEFKGNDLPDSLTEVSTLTNKSGKHTAVVGMIKIIGTHKLNPTKKPREIDSKDTEGPYAGKSYKGIYTLDDTTFKVCFAPPGQDRPTEFTTKSGTGELIHCWKRK